MKKLLLMLAAVATLFTACTEECNHDFIEVDYSNDIVGTWTCLEADFAQAFVFKADGTAITVGVENGEYWEDVQVNWKVENNKLTLSHKENVTETLLEIIPGQLLAIKGDKRRVYQYCANDLADEIVGMWVCNDSKVDAQNDMMIETFDANGKTSLTGFLPMGDNPEYVVNDETDYKVVGDLMFLAVPADKVGGDKPRYIAERLIYTPNATAHGDIMTFTNYSSDSNELLRESWLRIKESLDLVGQNYNYIKTFVSNVKGEDKDINFMGYTFNFAKMDGSGLDKMLKALLFAVEFPDANTLGYSYQMNGNKETYNSPIVVEGNTMTIKMSEKVATLKDVVLYAFQDADCSQLHFYMHKTAFVNFYTNMQAMLMDATDEQFDITNAEAVNAIYDNINNAVETINVSLVMSK